MRRLIITLAALAATLLAACGTSTPAVDGPGQSDPGPMAVCAPDVPDCVDTIVNGDPGPADEDAPMTDNDHIERARTLIGTAEADLPGDVRIGRRGDEDMMLAQDYVVGRRTVALDDDGSGTYVVTAVTVELDEGPETITE